MQKHIKSKSYVSWYVRTSYKQNTNLIIIVKAIYLHITCKSKADFDLIKNTSGSDTTVRFYKGFCSGNFKNLIPVSMCFLLDTINEEKVQALIPYLNSNFLVMRIYRRCNVMNALYGIHTNEHAQRFCVLARSRTFPDRTKNIASKATRIFLSLSFRVYRMSL